MELTSYEYTYNNLLEKISVPDGKNIIYGYDVNGNMLKQTFSGQIDTQVIEYVYNAQNQLIQYKGAQNAITTYSYKGDGQRISKTSDVETTKFYWDRNYIVNAFYSNNRAMKNQVNANSIGHTVQVSSNCGRAAKLSGVKRG